MITIFGLIGLTSLLLAFSLLSAEKIKQEDWQYNVLNLVGAAFLAFYAWHSRAYVFVVLEGFWAVIAFFELLQHKRR